MKVLVTTTAGLGHIHPMVPLARALASRGHDVLWATPADGVAHVERTGIPAVAAGPAALVGPAQMHDRFPETAQLAPEDAADVAFAKLFGAIAAPAILAELEPIALDLRPDLVVSEAAELAGHIVAAKLGVPSVTKGFGQLIPEHRVRSAAQEVAPLWRSRGLEPRPYCGCYDHLYIDINPPALTPSFPDYIPHRQLMAPFSDDGHAEAATTPPLPEARPDAPLVYVTMGTVFTDVTVLQAVLAAMRDLDVRVVVTVGPRIDPTALGPQPTHVRVEQYVPQAALLPHSSLVISHGGSGTGLATLRHGLPQLCLPQGADQFLNAATITKAGAGLTLMPSGVDEIAIADAVRRLLTDPSYRSAASVVADSIAAMPTPDDVAAVLEDICR